MFSKILIANRGEVALRIMRACAELGISTVLAVSEADRESLPALLSNRVICVGPAPSKDSYLSMENIISAALLTGCEAIHPGYGFLSENAHFAEVVKRSGLEFIGPSADAIRLMGDKAAARKAMRSAGVPVVPGSDGELTNIDDFISLAKKIGYPVLVKASAGGGGRGIRRADNEKELRDAILSASAEAKTAFGNGGLYLEKLLLDTRHIEVQILADGHGNVISLGERECSLQRRRQKVMEECPGNGITQELRAEMSDAAIRAAKAVNYKNAGTVEFLLCPDGNFYFMEMNTRLQVEHPVTEMVCGIDIVKEQIRIAAGLPMSFTQNDIVMRGHAIETRINAERPEDNFRPSTGKIVTLNLPGGNGVRFDGHIYQGYELPVYYDSLMGKLIIYGANRPEALARMSRALSEFVVEGVDTNLAFLQRLMEANPVVEGNYTTATLEEILSNL